MRESEERNNAPGAGRHLSCLIVIHPASALAYTGCHGGDYRAAIAAARRLYASRAERGRLSRGAWRLYFSQPSPDTICLLAQSFRIGSDGGMQQQLLPRPAGNDVKVHVWHGLTCDGTIHLHD